MTGVGARVAVTTTSGSTVVWLKASVGSRSKTARITKRTRASVARGTGAPAHCKDDSRYGKTRRPGAPPQHASSLDAGRSPGSRLSGAHPRIVPGTKSRVLGMWTVFASPAFSPRLLGQWPLG